MKVLITSSGFSKKAPRTKIEATFPPNVYKKIAYITTASKVVAHPEYAKEELLIMQKAGYEVEEIDLAEITGDFLENKLKNCDFIYVQGGNPYWLLKNIRSSGFFKLVPKLIAEGKPYVGKSAGAYILGPEVLTPTWYSKEWRKFGVEDLKGMGIVNFIWAAHYNPEDTEMTEDIKKGIKLSPYPVRIITNDQGFLIENNEIIFFGEGEEVVLDHRYKT